MGEASSRAARVAAITVVAAAAWLSGCGAGGMRIPEGQPNMIVLLLDCLRADHVGVNGYERPTTPNLDRFAAEGVNFTRAFSQSQWTRPSVPSLLTGLYPAEHGLVSLRTGERSSGRQSLAPEVETLAESLSAKGYATALFGEQAQLSRRFGLNQGFDRYQSDADFASRINMFFMKWVTGLEGAPFFAYLHYLEIHWPYCPPESTRDMFGSSAGSLKLCKDWRRLRREIETGRIVPSPEDVEAIVAAYDEELVALDAELGRLFERLRRAGLWDETLIVVTSDHGEQFFEHGTLGHAQGLWNELIHVPLLVKPPASWGVPPARTVDTLAELRDVKPTLLHALGVEPAPGIHSLLPWILDDAEAAIERPWAVAESGRDVAVQTKTHKLIVAREGGGLSLFDLVADPGEQRNVARERREDLARLRGYLELWQQGLDPVRPLESELTEETVEGLRALGYLD